MVGVEPDPPQSTENGLFLVAPEFEKYAQNYVRFARFGKKPKRFGFFPDLHSCVMYRLSQAYSAVVNPLASAYVEEQHFCGQDEGWKASPYLKSGMVWRINLRCVVLSLSKRRINGARLAASRCNHISLIFVFSMCSLRSMWLKSFFCCKYAGVG